MTASADGSAVTEAAAWPRLRAVILDFDGLIVDTETPIFEAWHQAYRRRGHDLGLDLWQHALGTHGGFDPLTHLDGLCGGLDREALLAEVKAHTARGCDQRGLLPGVRRLLEDARALGLGRAVASSSSEGWVVGWLERLGVRGLFDVVAARDHVTRVKPDPELFLLAAERLAAPPASCLVFEDSPNGMRAARAAGMRCVAVPNALTSRIARPPVDLVVESLADEPLALLLQRLEAARAGAVGSPLAAAAEAAGID